MPGPSGMRRSRTSRPRRGRTADRTAGFASGAGPAAGGAGGTDKMAARPRAKRADMTAYPELKLYIDGEWVGAGQRRLHKVINPATGGTLGELPLVDVGDLDRALEAADRGFRQWKRATADERARVLKGAAQLIRQRVDHIARVATLEEGKTLAETRIEAQVAANLFEFYAEECRRTYGRVLVRPTGTRSLVVKEPVGPVAAFAPWNFPIGNPARKLGAPVAAGCSVILKPAEEAPASAMAVV